MNDKREKQRFLDEPLMQNESASRNESRQRPVSRKNKPQGKLRGIKLAAGLIF
jgi:hypothetical protein